MSVIVYFMKVSVALFLFWIMYSLIFRRLTFFTFNRFYLLGSVLLSFSLPLVNFPANFPESAVSDYNLGIDWEHFVMAAAQSSVNTQENLSASLITIIIWTWTSIAAVLILRALWSYLAIRRRYAGGYARKVGNITLIVHSELKVPFTVFRRIYLDANTYKRSLHPVIRHEMIHARQLHSLDLLIIEIACALLWFNPFVFLFRRHIRDNNEYLADDLAQQGREELVEYMRVLSDLVSRSVVPAYASYFKSSTIKKRIMMLTNKKSNKKKRWIYFLVLPLIVFTLLSFQQPVKQFKGSSLKISQVKTIAVQAENQDIPCRFPLNEKYRVNVTLGFGWEGLNPVTKKKMKHKGIDLKAPTGTPVYATANGEVVKAIDNEAYGKVILVKHDQGFTTLYAHLDELLVKPGGHVEMGQKIATVGNTGYSTGPHLHYEVRKNDEHVDPSDYF